LSSTIALSPYEQLVARLRQIADHWQQAVAELALARIAPDYHTRRKALQRDHGARPDPLTGALVLPGVETTLLPWMRAAALDYVAALQSARCPPPGAYARHEACLPLLHQGREIYHQALGTEVYAQAHREAADDRERIRLAEPCGDLERAAAEAGLEPKLYQIGRPGLKRLLFRAVAANARALRNRRDADGNWWFPQGPIVRVPGVAIQAALGTVEATTGTAVEIPGFAIQAALGTPGVETATAPNAEAEEVRPPAAARPSKLRKRSTGKADAAHAARNLLAVQDWTENQLRAALRLVYPPDPPRPFTLHELADRTALPDDRAKLACETIRRATKDIHALKSPGKRTQLIGAVRACLAELPSRPLVSR
jgi:hypothetical protein